VIYLDIQGLRTKEKYLLKKELIFSTGAIVENIYIEFLKKLEP